jgi:hypothetical protein
MKPLRFKDFKKRLKRFSGLTIGKGKGSEIKVFGVDSNGTHRIHVMGKHGKNPEFSVSKIHACLRTFGISSKGFFED